MNNDVIAVIDLKNYKCSPHTIIRTACRAIIKRDDGLYAMISSAEYGEYKFAGGGMERNETEKQTLIREVLEETGLTVIPETIEYYGKTIERKRAIESSAIFEQHSKYFYCQVKSDELHSQNLDDYEKRLDYHLKWIDLREAYNNNLNLPYPIEKTPWLRRDNIVIERLLEAAE